MRYTKFAKSLGTNPGISRLMEDLGNAMSGVDSSLMLGGGNPGVVPELRAAFKLETQKLLNNSDQFDELLGNYDPPQGRPAFISALSSYLNGKFNWNISEKNICITNGSQNASYSLFNMFAEGDRKIILPLCPEYLGYADQGVGFTSFKPTIQDTGPNRFKYRVDFDNIKLNPETCGAIALSRPTNPTGNVVTNIEIEKLRTLAKTNNAPLIIDNAYGAPFPGMIFSDIKPVWDENIILLLSLSKLGLPSTRTGIVIANEEVISKLSAINAVCSLSNGSLGQQLLTPMLLDGQIDELCSKFLRPFYEKKAKFARELFSKLASNNISYKLHETEGTMFLWVWFDNLSISSEALYRNLAKRGVIVVPGQYFFFGMDTSWEHCSQCIRINYGADEETVRQGFEIIVDEVEKASQ